MYLLYYIIFFLKLIYLSDGYHTYKFLGDFLSILGFVSNLLHHRAPFKKILDQTKKEIHTAIMKAVIFDYNSTIYKPDSDELTEGALDLLHLLKQKDITLFLVAKGDEKRRARIQELGLEPYFKKIIVNQQKSGNDYGSCKNEVPAGTEFFAVGDRIKEEITYANEQGMITIWFKSGKFSTEEPENEAETPAFIITHLSEAADIILG
ncbi:MAG: hypothetical protein JWM56_346 [Candidatus Peribacteria bacterium]|nr:hypothetical protein [Candidatus Peribacteria bacterium]